MLLVPLLVHQLRNAAGGQQGLPRRPRHPPGLRPLRTEVGGRAKHGVRGLLSHFPETLPEIPWHLRQPVSLEGGTQTWPHGVTGRRTRMCRLSGLQ